MKKKSSIGFYPIVDSSDWVQHLLHLGVKSIQLRIKDKPLDFVEAEILKSQAFLKQSNARLYINDYWQIAIKHQTFGIHLGYEDLQCCDVTAIKNAGIQLGISTHNQQQIDFASKLDPDYIALGPIFPTGTKQLEYEPHGILQLSQYVKQVPFPVVAIGGIELDNVDEVVSTGVDGVAVISAVTHGHDLEQTVQQFLSAIDL